MATKTASGMVRLDVNDPKDVQVLVNSGLAWRGGPNTLQTIFQHIAGGAVARRPEKETPEVRAYLDKIAPVAAVEPTTEEPVEPPMEAPLA